MIQQKGGLRGRGEWEGESSPIFPMPDFLPWLKLESAACQDKPANLSFAHERKSKILVGFFFSGIWIPDCNSYWDPGSLSCIPDSKAQNSELQKKTFASHKRTFSQSWIRIPSHGAIQFFLCVLRVNNEDNYTTKHKLSVRLGRIAVYQMFFSF